MAMTMSSDFDPQDAHSWYFGRLSREDTNNLLRSERDNGVFLVRDSTSISGDYVLCVKEESRVSHYIINKIQTGASKRFRIGDQEFPDLPALLRFYKTHYLDTTPLIKPAQRERVITKFDFPGKDPEDLAFRKGEILTILQKDEEQWWTAKNSRGEQGVIPVPYVRPYTGDDPEHSVPEPSGVVAPPQNNIMPPRTLPATAKVIKDRIPNAYDKTALKLKAGDVVLVTAMNMNGQWEGEINGHKGVFPFTHVKFMDSENEHEDD